MSVRMALAKLCACACGGAVIGGSGVYVAERVDQPRVAVQKQVVAKRRVIRKAADPSGLVAEVLRAVEAEKTA